MSELLLFFSRFSLSGSAEAHTEGFARRVVKAVLTALAHLHRNKIIHKDVSPENVLLSRDGTDIRLGGFSLSKVEKLCVLSYLFF